MATFACTILHEHVRQKTRGSSPHHGRRNRRKGHARTLRRAHERRDVELALGLYDERARVRLVGRGAPPNAPKVFEGKESIAEYLRETFLGGWTPRVGYSLSDVVEGDGRIVLNVAYFDAGGARELLASETYVVSGGKIVDQLNIEVRGE